MFYQYTRIRTIAVILFLALFICFLFSSVINDSSAHLVRILTEKSFPLEMVILEGVAGLSQPEREYIQEFRYQAAGLGMYMLTGVNISDARTYFLNFYAPPSEGLPWLGWAYHPNDPEMEGPILEPLDNPFHNKPAPITSEDDVLVAVYHTHNAECYAGDGGKDRVLAGENGEVVEIGEQLIEALNQKGIKAIHSEEVNDKVYIESYNRAYQTARKMVEENPTIRILLDIHRDGIPPQVGKSTARVEDKEAAKVLIVIGQKNPNWEKNYKIAKEIIAITEKKYPGLFFPDIRFASEARYNQHLTDGALLLEIGSQMNTMEEAKAAVEPLAEVLKVYLEK